MFRGSDAEIGGRVHPHRHGHGQELVLSAGASEDNGTGLLRAPREAHGCFGALVLPSVDTFVSACFVQK